MKKRENFLSYALPSLTECEIQEVNEILNSLWWSRGQKCDEFERRFAEYVGAKYAVSVNSCTAALHLALKGYDIGKGDEVITTPMTFCSTINVIIHQGSTPVFCDIDETTGLIDTAEIEKHITDKTKAIIPVHYAGQACELDKIKDIANKYRLKVLDDAAHAVATTYKGQKIGGLTEATSFSFYATKNLSTGEGGMLTTNDEGVYNRIKKLSLHGMDKNAFNRYKAGGSHEYDVSEIGYKYNMTDIAAGLGLCQLERLPTLQKKRKKLAEIYLSELAGIDGIDTLRQVEYGENAWHLFVIKLDPDKLSITRDEFIAELSALNIGTSVHFKPVHMFSWYKENLPQNKPLIKAEGFYKNIISLPLYPSMSEEDAYYVMEGVRWIACRYAK